ncbi:MAG: hypothetical protein HY040_20710 [Planctomycetes bacterium]|nr:hypothetical protein [Planctomycetota bacterium]
MNTVGKILVILNLVFALITGGFLVIDFATRTNWKNSYDQIKRDTDVMGVSSGLLPAALAKLNNELTLARAQVDKVTQDLVDAEVASKIKIENYKIERDDAVVKLTAAELTTKVAQAEAIRMKEEIKGIVATVSKREQDIANLQSENKRLRTDNINMTVQTKSMQDRNEVILEEHQKVLKQLAKYQSGVAPTPDGSIIRDANQANPPSTYVRGKIETVDPADKGLVRISLGSDNGLQKNHTLEVYRMDPRPQYLGMIRIVETDHHRAVGRLMSSSVSTGRVALREGDTVASSLNQP